MVREVADLVTIDGSGVFRMTIKAGTDNGARIRISGSTFLNSHFCRGLLAYSPTKAFSFEESPATFVNLTSLGGTQTDTGLAPKITISGSTFFNLDFGSYLQYISTTIKPVEDEPA